SFMGNLAIAMGCFSGNLVWPIEQFKKIGGFWHELHHGRCEDGELGIRAATLGVLMALVPKARGWHIYHGGMPSPKLEWINYAEKINKIDIPKIHARHGIVEETGIKITSAD